LGGLFAYSDDSDDLPLFNHSYEAYVAGSKEFWGTDLNALPSNCIPDQMYPCKDTIKSEFDWGVQLE